MVVVVLQRETICVADMDPEYFNVGPQVNDL